MGEYPYEEGVENSTVNGNIGSVKKVSDVIKNTTVTSEETNQASYMGGTEFKFATTSANLPEKTSFWTKLKNALFYEVKVELTPYQQKIEDEINDFLHQEITWKSLKEAALAEVPITFKGKRIF